MCDGALHRPATLSDGAALPYVTSHPATVSLPGQEQAYCLAEFIQHAYPALADAIDELLRITGRDEWSTEELVADRESAEEAHRLPVEELVLYPRYPISLVEASRAEAAAAPLRQYATEALSKLNGLNRWLHAQRRASQITSASQITGAEFTFHLNRTHFAHDALIFHVDHGEIDETSAVFVVSLRSGSRPTLLLADPTTRSSAVACAATSSIRHREHAACASAAAGAATYFALHHCHARPSHELPEARRDVLSVHVRWSSPPAPDVFTRGWHHDASEAEGCVLSEGATSGAT